MAVLNGFSEMAINYHKSKEIIELQRQFQNISVDLQSERKQVQENESEVQMFKSPFNSEGNCVQELEEKQKNEEKKFFAVEKELLTASIQGQQTDLNDRNQYGNLVSVIKKVNHEFQLQILRLIGRQ